MLPGKVLGGFKYLGTRPDDPNDLVPHEHRRELRALRVFGAWANLVDQKAGNTLDTVITDGKRGVVKHYLQDVGSTFGVGANAPHDWNEGWEYVIEGGPAWRKLFTLGLARSEYQKADYEDVPAAGRFEGDSFDPLTWRPRVPTGSHIEMRDDDAFWAARRLMAVTDELIRAAVKTGQYRDPAAEQHIADVLIKRRDKIGQAYLPKINPIVDPAFDGTHVDLRQRRRPVQGGRGAGVVHRRVVAVRQRHRYGDANRRHHEQGAEGGGPERAAHHPGLVRQGGAQCAEHESPVLGAADRRLLQARRHRLETGWSRADARRRCSGAAEGELSHGTETSSRSSRRYLVTNGKKFRLKDHDPDDHGKLDKARSQKLLADGIPRLADLQERLYAQDKWGVLLVFQAMDAAGKDGAIKHVMSGINPQGCQVFSFKAPSAEDLDHDFLWRTSKALPERGRIGIFNRSYYEEVLVVRVHPTILGKQKLPASLVSKDIWAERCADIASFERYMARNGYVIRKFFLNVSRKEQRKRFLERLTMPEKNWKFSMTDAKEAEHWNDYQDAYEDAIRRTATPEAPWVIVPADNKWYARLVVGAAVVSALDELDLKFPVVDAAKKTELEAARLELEAQGGGAKKKEKGKKKGKKKAKSAKAVAAPPAAAPPAA